MPTSVPFEGFATWGLGLMVWGVWCGVWGVGFGVEGLGFGVWGVGCGVWGVGCGVWCKGYIYLVAHYIYSYLGFRVETTRERRAARRYPPPGGRRPPHTPASPPPACQLEESQLSVRGVPPLHLIILGGVRTFGPTPSLTWPTSSPETPHRSSSVRVASLQGCLPHQKQRPPRTLQ